MARLQGISGGMSGRTGSFTYRQSRGETIVSQYQPTVKNPNTQGQQDQRARFKLMSQLAAIMSPGFGTMGVTKRPGKQRPTQRNAFIQLNMPLVEVATSQDNKVTAKIPMEQVKLTTSNRFLPQVSLLQNDNEIEASFANVPTEVASIRAILIGYRGEGKSQATILSIGDYPAENKAETIIYFPATAGNYTVLAFGLIPTESAKTSINLDNIHTPADENFISAVELNTMVAEGSMLETMTTGANISIE